MSSVLPATTYPRLITILDVSITISIYIQTPETGQVDHMVRAASPLTGRENCDIAKTMFRMGVCGYLVKPFDENILAQQIALHAAVG
jgi:response regulator of citrate/malate metabolism